MENVNACYRKDGKIMIKTLLPWDLLEDVSFFTAIEVDIRVKLRKCREKRNEY